MSLPSLAPVAAPPSMVWLANNYGHNFRYALYNDDETWNTWTDAVSDPLNNATDQEIAAAEKFSPYLFKAILAPSVDGDGFCVESGIYSPPFGGWCLFYQGS